MLPTDLANTLKKELASALPNSGIVQPIQDILQLLAELIVFPTNFQMGLQDSIPQALECYESKNLGSVANIKLLANELEGLLKKIVLVLDGDYSRVPKASDGNFYLKDLGRYLYLDNHDYFRAASRERNDQAHNSEKMPSREFYTEVENLVLSYLRAVDNRYAALRSKLRPEEDFTEYLKSVKKDYDFQNVAFVDLQTKESFDFIDVIGKEVQAHGDRKPARLAPITELRQKVTENQMMIVGEAGMGKTTAMLKIAQDDGQEYINKKGKTALPVYINLSSIIYEQDTIVGKLAQRMERSENFVENYLRAGKLNVYLDGYNEVLPRMVTVVLRGIQQLVDQYPNTKITIASRPTAFEDVPFYQAGNGSLSQRKPVPAFILQNMSNDLVKKFIDLNYSGDKASLWVKLQDKQNQDLLLLLSNPLYLHEFISVYEKTGQMPNSSTSLTSRFFKLKYQREEKINPSFDSKTFAAILLQYAHGIAFDDAFGLANPLVPENHALKVLNSVIKEYHHQMSAQDFLRYSCSLHILKKDRQEQYCFVHQSYLDFLAED